MLSGTFQQYVRTYSHTVTPIPEDVSSPAACPILCAGVTVYKAVRDANTRLGDWVVIPGAGGGLGHLAIQYAVAKGLRVVAVDTGEKKRTACLDLGAEKFIDFKESGGDLIKHIMEATDGLGPHVALVVAASSSEAYTQACMYLRRGGYLMVLGLPKGNTAVMPLTRIAAAAITIMGSFVGNRQDTIEALRLVSAGKIKPSYEIRPMSELNTIAKEMKEGKLVGRVVVDVNQ